MVRLRSLARSPLLIALVFAMTAAVLQGGSVPHTHAGIGPGFYNQDHDGALLATLHGVATFSAGQPAVEPVLVLASIVPDSSAAIHAAPRSLAASRAPPQS